MAKEQAEQDLIAKDHAIRLAKIAGIDNPEEKVELEVPATVRFGDAKLYELMVTKARNAMNEESLQKLEGDDSEPAFEVEYPQVPPEGKPEGESLPEGMASEAEEPEEEEDAERSASLEDVDGVTPEVASNLRAKGYHSPEDLKSASDEELLAVDGIGNARLESIRKDLEEG
jgi:predicted flap endonuclease-1-like 5' DNA nuclease